MGPPGNKAARPSLLLLFPLPAQRQPQVPRDEAQDEEYGPKQQQSAAPFESKVVTAPPRANKVQQRAASKPPAKTTSPPEPALDAGNDSETSNSDPEEAAPRAKGREDTELGDADVDESEESDPESGLSRYKDNARAMKEVLAQEVCWRLSLIWPDTH